jgi:hypothetical protein
MRPAQKKSRFRWEKHNGGPQGCGDLDKEPCPEGENLKRAHIISKVEHETLWRLSANDRCVCGCSQKPNRRAVGVDNELSYAFGSPVPLNTPADEPVQLDLQAEEALKVRAKNDTIRVSSSSAAACGTHVPVNPAESAQHPGTRTPMDTVYIVVRGKHSID